MATFTLFTSICFCLLLVTVKDGSALRCYACIHVLQSGVDCVRPLESQLRPCAPDEDSCRTTIGTILVREGVTSRSINRECAKSVSTAGLQLNGDNFCSPLGDTRLCQCSKDGCNTIVF